VNRNHNEFPIEMFKFPAKESEIEYNNSKLIHLYF
jgi:hypothetical protein